MQYTTYIITCRQCCMDFDTYNGRGRPPHRCNRCRGLGSTPIPKREQSTTYGGSEQRAQNKGFNYSPKRTFQKNCYEVLSEFIKLSDRPIASLCDLQHGTNDQINLLITTGIIASTSQYMGFCYDPKDENGSADKILRNSIQYPEALWFYSDMCSSYGINLMCRNSIGIIDYDSCWSLQNKKVRSDLSILFQETNLPSDVIIMANVLIKNRGYKAEDWKTTDLQLGEIPGFDGWEVVWFNDYISKKEGKPGCPPVYRTLLMCKKQGFSGTPVSFYFVRRRKRNK